MVRTAFYAAVDRSGGIFNSYSSVAGDLSLATCKPTLSSGNALKLGLITAINPRQPGYNYNVVFVLFFSAILYSDYYCTSVSRDYNNIYVSVLHY